jgi:cytochrome c556
MRAGAAILALALVTAAGCGDDDGGGLSKSELVAKADAICKKSNPPDQKTPKNAAQAKKAAQDQVDYRQPIQAELSKLDPSDQVKGDFDKFQAATQKAIDAFKQQVVAADKNQESRYGQLNRQLDGLFKQRDQLADKIGFKWCGQPVAPSK